jgi:hypothetical protein
MNLYEIIYHIKLNEDTDIKKNRLYQIPATTEYNAVVRLGQIRSEENVIDIISVKKVGTQ